MKDKYRANDRCSAQVDYGGGCRAKPRLRGRWRFECYDRAGRLKWIDDNSNLVVNQGLNHLLDVVFHGVTPVSPWYIGLIDNASYSALAAGDSLSSHAGWIENTDYAGDRKEWTEGAASSQSITNAATVDFAMNATVTIKGAFLCSAATGTSGTLMCEVLFSQGDRPVANGDTIKVTYTISAADS